MDIREKSLFKNTLIITIGKICTQMITFFLLPLYTGILSTEEYGLVDLLNTLILLLVPLITFQIEQAIFRELIEVRNSEIKKKKIISSGIISVISQCIFYILIFIIISIFIKNDYKLFLITNVVSFIFSSLFLQISRGLGDNRKFSIGSFIIALSTIVFNIIFLIVFKLSAKGILLGTMFGYSCGIVFLFFELKLYKYISVKSFDFKIVKKLLKYSIPLIPNAISWWIFNASDKIIVSTVLGLSANGILSAAHKFSTVYITLYNVFNISWTENIALHINDIDIKDYFSKMFNMITRLFISLAMIIISCMFFVYPLMINSKFDSGYMLIPILIIASFFNVVVGLISVIYLANKNTKAIANTSVISAIINIVTHLLLIKFIGLYAAAISTFIAFFIMSIYRLYDINKKYFNIKIEKLTMIKSIIFLSIILIIYYLNNIMLNILSVFMTMLFTYYINKDSFNNIINLIIKKAKKYWRVNSSNYFDTLNKSDCNGCGICSLKCPKKAIEMVEDDEGFLYPVIDKNKCINCGLCKKICSNFPQKNNFEIKAFAASNKNVDECMKSTSGGIFKILAKNIIDKGGIVFGVKYTDTLDVEHDFAETLEDCDKFSISKYVRSDLKDSYEKIKRFLEKDKYVLFTGTPCQNYALKKYLGKEYDKLILCEIVCHSNPSPKIFKLYKKNIENIYNKKIKNYYFRSKNVDLNNQPYVEFYDGSKIVINSFNQAFNNMLISRPSCSNCRFCDTNRKSDITIGDFWGVSTFYPNYNTTNGVSLLCINSSKGMKIYDEIKNELVLQESNLCNAFKYNHHFNIKQSKKRKKFFKKIKNGTINENNIIKYMNKYSKTPIHIKLYRKIKNYKKLKSI